MSKHLLIIPLLLALSCGDSYTPPNNVIIDENNMTAPPAGSAEVAVGAPSGPLLEGGSPVTFTVALKLAPMAPVTIALTSSNEAAGTVSPATLTFDMTSWATPQTVTLTPVDDEVATGDKPWEVRFELTSDDPSFAGKPVTPLKLTTVDNDAAPTIVAVAVSDPRTTEAGGAATITVQLSKQPKSDVLIPIALSDPAEADLSVQSMTFTTLDWNLPQQVVATGKDDKVKDGDKAYKVLFGPANSADEEFNSIGPAEVALTGVDGVCGNGTVDGAEACEPTGMNDCELGQMDCMVCNNSCELVPGNVTGFCGDGITQAGNDEECDAPTMPCPYGQMSCMTCDAQCKRIAGQLTGFCGDGAVQAAQEQCDAPTMPCPYGQMSCVTCRNCQNTPGQVTGFCGDGVVQAASGEECDPQLAATACPAGTAGDTTCLPNTCKITAPCSQAVATGQGHYYGCALFASGAVRCWGGGDGNPVGLNPELVPGLPPVAQIAANYGHTCFLMRDETVRCVGDNFRGQLGTGDNNPRSTPTAVPGLTGVKQLAVGREFTCALLKTGAIKCWGDGLYGQRGDGQSGARNTPVDVMGISNGAQIEAGELNACAVLTTGQIKCWGIGAIGDGTTDSNKVPVTVSGITNAAEVSVGIGHACARLTTGQARCWGENILGALGDSSTSVRYTPVAVSGLSGVAQIAAGRNATCARLTSGAIKCWGSGQDGMLGDGQRDSRSAPGANVTGISDAIDIAATFAHVCAVRANGVTMCWGANSEYQLGGGTFSNQEDSPVTVSF